MVINRKYYILFLVLIWACNDSNSQKENHIRVIKLDPLLSGKKEKVNLSEIAESIEYIPLETNERSIFGHIVLPEEQIKFFEKGILISDKNRLLHFSYQGDYIGEIGKRGIGPTEYANIRDFTINPRSQQIAIFSPPNQRAFDRKGKGNGYHFALYNDMDGGLPFWPHGEMSDNRVFKLVYPHELLAHFTDEISSVKIGLPLHSLDKSDNPILMIVKLKD